MIYFLLFVIAIGVFAILSRTKKNDSPYHCSACINPVDSRATICASCHSPIDPTEMRRQYVAIVRRERMRDIKVFVGILIFLVFIAASR